MLFVFIKILIPKKICIKYEDNFDKQKEFNMVDKSSRKKLDNIYGDLIDESKLSILI